MAMATHQPVAGVILAGGQARRMGGGDKCLMQLGGATMLQRIFARFAPQVDEIFLSANGSPSRFAGLGLEVVPDTIGGFAGPLAGVLAGLRHAADLGYERVATAPADSPFLPHDFVERLGAAAGNGRAVAIASSAGRLHPVAALWPVALADQLEHWLGVSEDNRKALAFIRRHAPCVVPFPTTGRIDPFFNVNTPDDLRAAEAVAAYN